jgi:hypothetical protein
MTLRYVKSGDSLRIPASDYNAFVDAARDFRNRSAPGTRGRSGASSYDGTVLAYNSGEPIELFDAVGIEDIATPPRMDCVVEPCAVVRVPTEEDRGRFGVAVTPIPSGDYGRIRLSGETWAKVEPANSESDATYTCDIEPDSSILKPGAGAGTILWKKSGDDFDLALVRFGGGSTPPAIYGTLDDDFSAGGSATISIHEWIHGGWSDVNRKETIYAPPTFISGTIEVSDEKPLWISAEQLFGRWWARIPVPITVLEPLTNWQVDDAGHVIQVKSRPTIVTLGGDESDWKTVYTGVECT